MDTTQAGQSALPEAGNDARRTISVVRRRTRFTRLKVEYPECVLNGPPRLHYDVSLVVAPVSSSGVRLPGRWAGSVRGH
jgi:hypothetical protein